MKSSSFVKLIREIDLTYEKLKEHCSPRSCGLGPDLKRDNECDGTVVYGARLVLTHEGGVMPPRVTDPWRWRDATMNDPWRRDDAIMRD